MTPRPHRTFKMKAKITLLSILALALPAFAQDNIGYLVRAEAFIKSADGQSKEQIWIEKATDKQIRYCQTPQPDAADFLAVNIADVSGLFFILPRDFRAAVDLFESRNYKDAAAAFATIKDNHKNVMALANNPGALAAFYELECLRKLGDLEGLSKALKKFDKNSVTHKNKQRQLELYVLWDAVRTEAWERLDQLATERKDTKLPGNQRAQVAYCHGRALEGLGRPLDALMAYQTAITADAGASEVVVRESALRVLEILDADPAVKESIRLYDRTGGKSLNKDWTKVMEAAGVANLFELTLGNGAKLPEKFKHFLKYKTEPKPPVAAEAAPAAPAPAPPAEPAKAEDPKAKAQAPKAGDKKKGK